MFDDVVQYLEKAPSSKSSLQIVKPEVSVNKKLPDSEEYRQAANSIIVLTIPNIVQRRQTSPPRLLLTEADNTINDDQDQDRVSRKSCGGCIVTQRGVPSRSSRCHEAVT